MRCVYLSLRLLSVALVALVAGGLPEPLRASPLAVVQQSELMARFEQGSRKLNRKKSLNSWLPKDSNIEQVFRTSRGALLLNSWIAPDTVEFMPGKQTQDKSRECVWASRRFEGEGGELVIHVRTIVAHPRYAGMVGYGLIEPFAELQPPRLQSTFSMPVTVQGQQATAYQTTGGGASLTLTVLPGTVVNLKTDQWANLNRLLALAEKLDLHRLRQKLQSGL